MTVQLPLKLKLQDPMQLDDYVGAAADRLGHLHGLVFLSGRSGTGKSHLLQGVYQRSTAAGNSAVYLPTLEHLEPDVLEGLEQVDLVCLDNVDQVIGKTAWQVALFHLINGMKDQQGMLVVSSSVPLGSLGIELDDLGSRLKAAYLLSTDELDDDQKLQVVKLKAVRRGFEMSDEVCRFILSRAQRDMHHLARLVDRLDRETLRRQKKVTIPFVKAALDL